jgi:ferritin-like metal-binding protein YciE
VLHELDVEHWEMGQKYPVFYLVFAGGDILPRYEISDDEIEKVVVDEGIKQAIFNRIERLNEELKYYKAEVARLTSELIGSKMIIDKQGDEIKGLIKAKENITEKAKELVKDALINAQTIEQAAKSLGVGGGFNWMYLILGVGALFAIAYVLGSPESVQAITKFLSQERNQVFILILSVIILGMVYYSIRRRR